MYIDINLGVEGNLTLRYNFFDNPVARLLHERMKNQPNEVIDRTIFTSFDETVEDLQTRLTNIVEELKLHINLDNENYLDLNRLHENFPKYHQEYMNGNPVVFNLLRQFNTTIHHLEHLQTNNKTQFQFACEDRFDPIPIKDEWYNHFTPIKKKGYMYMHYPHVGKHFMELFRDDDIDVPADQIVLTSIITNTFSFWLSDDIFSTDEQYSKLQLDLENFHKKISHKLPYTWGDPRLAIGYIPVGKLQGDVDSLIPLIAKNKFVHSWNIG